jgi:hypothetical protein
MEHFSEQNWADFVRGVGNSENRAELESHLASDCGDCAAALNFWTRMHTVTTREGLSAPPPEVVRMVKLEFAARPIAVRAEPLVANLMWDSFSQPALAGVRSIAAAARQMVYEAEGLTVDLRFDRPPQSNTIHLIGQALSSRTPRISMAGASVMLWTEKGLSIGETRANEFGEFKLEFEAQNQLRLSIEIGKSLIRIPLANLKLTQDTNETMPVTHSGNR